MNFNVWNIKEMLSTPTTTGPNKFSIRSSAPSDYSSLSDSQLLFGSQFCPENVQSAATPLELGTQLGQHNSQDSDPSIFTKYQTKPQLFDEDTKEKSSLNFGAGRLKSVFENFEVNKNKIKDKYDREVLSTFISSIKDKLQGLQACLDKFGEMFDSRNKSILVHLETTSKTLQDALQSHCGSVLKALTDKSQMEQALLEMERRLAAKDVEILDVKSSIQSLKEGLESLPAQLKDQHLKLCEELGFLKLPNALAELHTFVSSARLPPHTADNSSQTSPGLRKAEAPEYPNNCYDWAGGGGGGTGPERAPTSDISKSLIRNPAEQLPLRALKDSNEAWAAAGGLSPKCPNVLAARSCAAFEQGSSPSLGELAFRPPSPIDLRRSIDQALCRRHLLHDGLFGRPRRGSGTSLHGSPTPATTPGLGRMVRCSSLTELPASRQPPTSTLTVTVTASASSLESSSLKISWNPWRHGLSSPDSLPLDEAPSRAPLLMPAVPPSWEREGPRSFPALSKASDTRSLSSDTIEL
ncbi:coiled-coil domain-containing protein 36 [Limosa lapponica baueri]|uniref:Coiled-coil domain-containing protein 36 n=1 Tax=Limosa lapponica baueri TaxID=1758121 RepID=A0A2I0TI37_LIMLA|nr:coiled-coil domain-containing protein 36 [Limosa lapponica baueri]